MKTYIKNSLPLCVCNYTTIQNAFIDMEMQHSLTEVCERISLEHHFH